MDAASPHDPHRPGYHFQPPRHWMNDPNGLIQFNGRYHLFYQHTPNATVPGKSIWGHAVSADLIRWRHLPHALEPTPGGYDKDGVWSGCAVDHHGVPTILYTGVMPEVQCLATAADPRDPDLVVWRKHPDNPIIARHPPGLELDGFRDPCVWRHGDHWLMALGSGIKASSAPAAASHPEGGGGGRGPALTAGVARGCVLLYRSMDLLRWEYLGILAEGDGSDGTTWECPNFFPLGDRWVLTVAFLPLGRNGYFTGRFDGRRFTALTRGELDQGGAFYAPQAFADEHRRRIMFGWLWERRTAELSSAAGWAGVQTLPRQLHLGEDGTLRFAPVQEVESLRGPGESITHVEPGDQPRLFRSAGDMLEINAAFAPPRGPEVPGAEGLLVRRSPSSSEVTRIVHDRAAATLALDTTQSSLEAGAHRDVRRDKLALADDEPLRLRVFVDRSVIEVFANERVCLTGRVYPTRGDAIGAGLFGAPGTRVTRCDVWSLRGG